MTWHEPWMVMLLEVSGDLMRMRALRQWFRARGFGHTVFLLGEGSSRGGATVANAESSPGHANGIVCAVSNAMSISVARRLGTRTLAVQALHKATRAQFNVTLIHGVSSDQGNPVTDSAPEESSTFSQQLEAATSWCLERHGTILMDANRIPCRKWREPMSAGLSTGDQALRATAGWRCDCCSTRQDAEGQVLASFIGEQLDCEGTPRWTRWGTYGDGVACRSRLDVGLSFPGGAVRWHSVSVVEPWRTDV